jgi:protein-disulfide isomerase
MSKNKEEKPKTNAPLLIIGAVLVIAIMVGLGMNGCGKSTAGTNNSNSTPKPTASTQTKGLANASPGANPPNSSGSPSAAVTIEEFADFQCPQCGAKHPVMNEIKSLYGSRIHFIFRDFPLSIPAHDKSYEAAVAAEAAGMQGKFWDMQNMLFSNQQAWTAAPTYKAIWKEYATKIGLDVPKWEADMTGLQAKSRVDQDLQRGRSAGVNSTPSLFINGNSVPFEQMTVDGIKALVDAELAKSSGKPAAAANSNAANAANAANTGAK